MQSLGAFVRSKARVHAAARRTAATHPSRMTVVVRVSRSEPCGVVQDASERRSSITKLHHTSSGNVHRPYPRRLRWMLVPRAVGGSYAITPVQ